MMIVQQVLVLYLQEVGEGKWLQVIKEGASVDEAVALALAEMNLGFNDVDIEVLEQRTVVSSDWQKRSFKVAVTKEVEEEENSGFDDEGNYLLW